MGDREKIYRIKQLKRLSGFSGDYCMQALAISNWSVIAAFHLIIKAWSKK